MAEINETKDGTIILECDCGAIHKIKWNEEKQEIEIKSSIKKNDSIKSDEKKEIKRTGIFSNRK